MAIWKHQGIWRDRDWLKATLATVNQKRCCLYCKGVSLKSLPIEPSSHAATTEGLPYRQIYVNEGVVLYCPSCGWWYARCDWHELTGPEGYACVNVGAGMLYSFALTQHPEAIEEARRFLLANFESAKKTLSPSLFEETVASVFKDFGYAAKVTAYTRDGGIDIALEKENETIGVQVKRYSNTIEVEQIRAFAGALVLNDIPRGVFVTTSNYQKGCYSAAEAYRHHGIPIELVNGNALFDALQIDRRPDYERWSELFRDPDVDLPLVDGNIMY